MKALKKKRRISFVVNKRNRFEGNYENNTDCGVCAQCGGTAPCIQCGCDTGPDCDSGDACGD